MLPREHRLTASRDFRAVGRGGARAGGAAIVVSALLRPSPGEVQLLAERSSGREEQVGWRCGLIVSKAVGNAVTRHRTARRLRHIILELLREDPSLLPGGHQSDLVIRALPAVTGTEYTLLRGEVRSGVRRAVQKAQRRREGSRGRP